MHADVQLKMLIEEVRLEAFPHLHFSMEGMIAGKWMDMKLLRPNKGETLQVLDDKNTPIDPSALQRTCSLTTHVIATIAIVSLALDLSQMRRCISPSQIHACYTTQCVSHAQSITNLPDSPASFLLPMIVMCACSMAPCAGHVAVRLLLVVPCQDRQRASASCVRLPDAVEC